MTSVAPETGEAVMRRLDALARFSADPGALTRLYLTPAHREAAVQVAAWMEEAGMRTAIDAAGTVVGRYEAASPGARTLLIGSHIDTIRDAGRYDGALGVVAGIAAVAELNARGERLPFAIEVLAFGDEEGVRFPVTLTSSRALAGTVAPDALDARDGDGISLREALVGFGGDPDGLPALARAPDAILAYLELHIEQGPVLEAEGLPVGIVTAIAGASRFTVTVTGQAGHAGTVPMRLRRDAVAAAAEMVLAAEAVAGETPDLVATVGVVAVPQGAVNVVAGEARFTLDVRSPSDAVRRAALDDLMQLFAAIAARRGVGLAVAGGYDAPAAACAPWLQQALTEGATRLGLRPFLLPSGAGHDGLALASLCPIGMVFVRCAGGISHSPAESITAADAGVAVHLLVDVLRHLAP